MNTYSKRLKELREENGLSQATLAKEIGIGQSSIAHWEAGQRVPNANVIIAFAQYFHVSADYILGLSDE